MTKIIKQFRFSLTFWARQRGLFFLCILICVSSCGRRSSPESILPQREESSQNVRVTDTIPTVQITQDQVIYYSPNHPEPLTQVQLDELSQCASQVRPLNQSIWFVRVLLNWDTDLTARIYYMPDFSDMRIRKGKYFTYNSYGNNIKTTKESFPDNSPSQANSAQDTSGSIPHLFREREKPNCLDYIQVSKANELFSVGRIEIPPQNNMLPFGTPKGFSEQEIIGIIDFIRSEPKVTRALHSSSAVIKIDPTLPIENIYREGETIEIRTGTEEGRLMGGGEVIEIKMTDSGYELIHVGGWIS
jgi:hypothetical protein